MCDLRCAAIEGIPYNSDRSYHVGFAESHAQPANVNVDRSQLDLALSDQMHRTLSWQA